MKDKNGKKIYEGDIVEWGSLLGTMMHSVIGFNERSFVFADMDEYQSGKYDSGLWAYDCLIIGNIHDNPELLKTE